MTSCAEARAVAGEAALGLLTGGERASFLAHVATCDACRADMQSMSAVADLLVLVGREAEPPAGFEARVLARLDTPPARRRNRFFVAAGAAAAAVVLVVAGVAYGRAREPHPKVAELTMRASDGRVVGEAYLHGDPAWVFVTVPDWKPSSSGYDLRVTTADGATTDVPGGDLNAGAGAWGTALPVDAAAVRSIALVGRDGRVWCSASLPT